MKYTILTYLFPLLFFFKRVVSLNTPVVPNIIPNYCVRDQPCIHPNYNTLFLLSTIVNWPTFAFMANVSIRLDEFSNSPKQILRIPCSETFPSPAFLEINTRWSQRRGNEAGVGDRARNCSISASLLFQSILHQSRLVQINIWQVSLKMSEYLWGFPYFQ